MMYIVDDFEEIKKLDLSKGDFIKTLDDFVSNNIHLNKNPEENRKDKRYIQIIDLGDYVSCMELQKNIKGHFDFLINTGCWKELKEKYIEAGFEIEDITQRQ